LPPLPQLIHSFIATTGEIPNQFFYHLFPQQVRLFSGAQLAKGSLAIFILFFYFFVIIVLEFGRF